MQIGGGVNLGSFECCCRPAEVIDHHGAGKEVPRRPPPGRLGDHETRQGHQCQHWGNVLLDRKQRQAVEDPDAGELTGRKGDGCCWPTVEHRDVVAGEG